MRDLLQTAIGIGIRVDMNLAQALWPAFADPSQIELVLLNLAINARDAMEGGVLTITTGNATLAAPSKPEEPPPGEYVEIAVADTGSGMSADVLAQAFEPFFTTKETGRGSGLGLSQVLGFAKQSGGGVKIVSSVGTGTSVHVYLPKAHVLGAVPRTNGETIAAAPRNARVLLVDDEAPVREVIAQSLRDLGHEVIEVGSAGAALEVIEHDQAFDVALLDFAMPGMNGAELARQIRTRRPGLGILFVTGYAETDALSDISDDRIIKKPLRQADLAEKLNAALLAHAA
jgi:CheY-like chemotaxis protein